MKKSIFITSAVLCLIVLITSFPLYCYLQKGKIKNEIETSLSFIEKQQHDYYQQITSLYPQLSDNREFSEIYEAFIHNWIDEEELREFIYKTVTDKNDSPIVQRLVNYNRELLLLMMKAHKSYITIELDKLNEIKKEYNEKIWVGTLEDEVI